MTSANILSMWQRDFWLTFIYFYGSIMIIQKSIQIIYIRTDRWVSTKILMEQATRYVAIFKEENTFKVFLGSHSPQDPFSWKLIASSHWYAGITGYRRAESFLLMYCDFAIIMCIHFKDEGLSKKLIQKKLSSRQPNTIPPFPSRSPASPVGI